MDRRTFLKTAAIGSIATGITATMASAERFFPTKVDQSLFTGLNRVKDPTKKTPLEKSHAPVISAPASVKAGEPFPVVISVGEVLHVMGQSHWIEYIDLAIGNEPAGRIDLQPNGYLKPKGTFLVIAQGGRAVRQGHPGRDATLQSSWLLGIKHRRIRFVILRMEEIDSPSRSPHPSPHLATPDEQGNRLPPRWILPRPPCRRSTPS